MGSTVRASVLDIPNAAESNNKTASPRNAPYVADAPLISPVCNREVGQGELVVCAKVTNSLSQGCWQQNPGSAKRVCPDESTTLAASRDGSCVASLTLIGSTDARVASAASSTTVVAAMKLATAPAVG